MPEHYDPNSFEEGGYPLFEESNPWGKDRELPEPPNTDSSENSDGFAFSVFFLGLTASGLIYIVASSLLKDSAISGELNCLVAFLSLFFGFGIVAIIAGTLKD